MKERLLLALALSTVVLSTSASAQDNGFGPVGRPQHSRPGVYAAEFGSAVGGFIGYVGAVTGLLYGVAWVRTGGDMPSGIDILALPEYWVLVLAELAAPAMAGKGVEWVGNALGEDGSGGGAILGAYAGALAGVLLGGAGAATAERAGPGWSVPLFVLAGAALPTGAVLGYNGGQGSTDIGPLGARIGVPALSCAVCPGRDGRTRPVLDCRLVTVRF